MTVVPETQETGNPFQDLLDMTEGQDSDDIPVGDLKRATSPGTFKDLEEDFARRKSPRREKKMGDSKPKPRNSLKGSPMRSDSDNSWTFKDVKSRGGNSATSGSGGTLRAIEVQRQHKPARYTRSQKKRPRK